MKTENTARYARFITTQMNRAINWKHVAEIQASMAADGFREYQPIWCIKNEAGELVIIDGHHRFVAAQRLGIPVHYIVLEGDGLEIFLRTIIELKHWTSMDLLQLHADRGCGDYATLLKWCLETKIGPTVAAKFFCTIRGAEMQAALKMGTWTITDEETPKVVKKIIAALAGWHGQAFAARSQVVNAVYQFCSIKPFDPERMCRQIDKFAGDILPMATTEAMAKQLQDVYNKGSGLTALNLAEIAAVVMHQRRTKKDRCQWHDLDALKQ